MSEKWFDGKVKPYILKNQTLHRLEIELNEIHRLSPQCEEQSFYDCLAKKLTEDGTCPSLSCLPLTVTSDARDTDYRRCNSTDFEICQKRFRSLLADEEICKGGAKCLVREYTATDSIAPNTFLDFDGFTQFMIHKIGSPKSSGGKRVFKPCKTVNTEFYILDEFQLIGQIGGTLGLMIGFSFLGSFHSIMENIIIFASWQREKCKHHEKSTSLTANIKLKL